MAGPILYSTNTWLAHDIATRYRSGKHYVWCSEYYDPTRSPSVSAAHAIAPSSSPKMIYDTLYNDCEHEDTHSALITGYKKTFKRLAKDWLSLGEINDDQFSEIILTVNSRSWKIWRPLLFIIQKDKVSNRIDHVRHKSRAAYGPEMRVLDLDITEFDVIER